MRTPLVIVRIPQSMHRLYIYVTIWYRVLCSIITTSGESIIVHIAEWESSYPISAMLSSQIDLEVSVK